MTANNAFERTGGHRGPRLAGGTGIVAGRRSTRSLGFTSMNHRRGWIRLGIALACALGLLTGLATLGAAAQAPTKASVVQYQPLSYSKQGAQWGCGIRVVVVTENERSIDSSINVNYVDGRVFGLLKVGFSDLKLQNNKFVEKKREVTFAKAENSSVAIDTKRGQKSDDVGYYVGAIEGVAAIQVLADTAEGKGLTFTISVKGDQYDHRIEVKGTVEPDVRRQVVECLGRIAARVEKD